jgi:hypothetical protein
METPGKPSSRDEETINTLLREFDLAERGRGVWNGHWQQVAEKVLPFYSNSFHPAQSTVPGSKKNQEQYDVTATAALWKFGSAMESMLTPASSLWHRMRPVDPILKRHRESMEWFDVLTETLFHYRYSPNAGFQANMHDGYIGIGAFGTMSIFTDAYKDPTRPAMKGLRYRHIHLGELYFAANHQGQIDKVFRKFRMTLRQIAQRWGKEVLPDELKTKLADKPEDEVWVVHRVEPNREFEPGRLDRKGKRFSSHYVLKDQKVMLEEGNGYRCMPYSVARYLTAPGELYGRSPAMNVLPSINVLNEEKKIMLKQGHRSVDPILLVHDDGIIDGMSMRPGSAVAGGVSADGRPLVHTLPVGNLAIGKDMMDDERITINDAFLVTLFQILVETPQMTATEVMERAREKGALLSPTMGRFQSECLGTMIEREVSLLMDQGLIPPPPRMLIEAGGDYKVEYDAPLNRAMRAEAAAGGMRTFQYAVEMAAQMQDPSILDSFNTDVMIPEMADINGMPVRWLRTEDDIAARRQGRQVDQTAGQLTQALPGMAAMMKATSPDGTAPTPGQGR